MKHQFFTLLKFLFFVVLWFLHKVTNACILLDTIMMGNSQIRFIEIFKVLQQYEMVPIF